MNINEATHKWVNEFNAYPYSMIKTLMNIDFDAWIEVTKPSKGDSVYTNQEKGEIIEFHKETELYEIELEDETKVMLPEQEFDIERYSLLPMWGTLWSFGDSCGQ